MLKLKKLSRRALSTIAVAVTLGVPALVIAQQRGLALFTDNEPLTTTRLNQLVTTVNSIDFGNPLFLEAVARQTALPGRPGAWTGEFGVHAATILSAD